MLAGVVGGTLGPLDTVSPIRRLLSKTKLYFREIESIDLDKRTVTLLPQFTHTPFTLTYDHIVIALGNVTDFRGTPGLHEHALPFKNLADAIAIRNQLIDTIEAAAIVEDPALKAQLLTFVVGGGGFSGTEVVAEVNDFVRKLAKQYPAITEEEVRVILAHSKDRLMDRELSKSLGEYAGKLLQERGVDIRFGTKLEAATPEEAVLSTEERIPSKTIISTVPSSPNPLIEGLDLPKEKGKIITDQTLFVRDGIWAIGDCAAIPTEKEGEMCPPTAQFAIREAKCLARNIIATERGKKRKPFYFKALGMMGALGHHSAVAELFGKIKFSGLFAWIMWRFVYWIKLPGFDRKLKVGLSWLLDMLIPPESVQLKIAPSQGISQLHYEQGETIFHQGDIGDYLYIIVGGSVEVSRSGEKIGVLKKGEFFGEMALLNEHGRSATVTSLEPTDVLALRKSDFGALIANFGELKTKFEETERQRRGAMGE